MDPKSAANRAFSDLWNRWSDYLLAPVDGSGLAVFRILFGALMAWVIADDAKVVESMFLQPAYLFSWFPFIKPWPAELFHIHYHVAFLAAILVSLGLYYRVAAAVLGASMTYFFFLDKANYVNHYYLVTLLSALLVLLPANQCFSLDRLTGPEKYNGKIPRWTQEILKVQIVIIYLFAASWKLNPDWLAGVTCHEFMANKGDRPIIGPYLTQGWFAHIMAYSGILIDYSVPVLLMIPRTVWLATAISLGFHLLNSFIFHRLDYFPYLMLGSLSLFYPYDWPKLVWAKVRRRWVAVEQAESEKASPATTTVLWQQPVSVDAVTPASGLAATPAFKLAATPASRLAFSSAARAASLIFFHVFLLVQAVLPLRCLTYPGNPDWTEQGYYFCWRLMVNNKKVTPIKFIVRDASTGEMIAVLTGKSMLNKNQLFRMEHHPELAHKFALWLADRVEKKTGKRPIITALQRASLHGRPWQFLIDPTVNLAAEPSHWGPKTWIVPLAANPASMNVKVRSMAPRNRLELHGKLADKPGSRWW